jgi:serine/threonine-protein kinase
MSAGNLSHPEPFSLSTARPNSTPAPPLPAQASKVLLEVIEGPHAPLRFEFTRHETFLVGRSRTAHLRLAADRSFSRHHFLLEIDPPRCFLRDLGSRNGTRVNGAKVREAYLKNGDLISGGQTRLRITLEPPGAALAGLSAACLACGAPAGAETIVFDSNVEGCSSYVCGNCRQSWEENPQQVSGYEVVRKLGKGGMGVVYLAKQLATGKLVALKLIVPESAASDRAVQMFLREVSIHSQLVHPRIVRFHEVGMARGQFFFVMEYVNTVNLPELLARQSFALRVKTLSGIFCQTLDALRFAHGRSFVHRDIKPANILVTRMGRKLRTKLADFGLAKNFHNGGFSGMTHQGDICGSLAFMAPEQLLDCRTARPASDIYSVGATFYYLLAGATPHDFALEKDPFAVVLEEDPQPLAQRCPEVPAGLAEIIHRSLARAPEKRFASAAEMRKLLLPYARSADR